MGDVHDIRLMKPDRGGRYMLDTNVVKVLVRDVLDGLKDVGIGESEVRRTEPYERFFIAGKAYGCEFYVSMLTFSEFAAYIENTYRRNYDPSIEKKAYRALSEERKRVRETVQLGWDHIDASAEILPCTIDATAFARARTIFYESSLDPYDALILESMRGNALSYIITDDRDFASAPGAIVYTVAGF